MKEGLFECLDKGWTLSHECIYEFEKLWFVRSLRQNIGWKHSSRVCFDHHHRADLLFSSLPGEDLDFGMEVHVNSSEQIRKEDQHRRESRKIFTPQTD